MMVVSVILSSSFILITNVTIVLLLVSNNPFTFKELIVMNISCRRLIKYIVPILFLCFINFQAQANRDHVNYKIEQAISNGEKLVEGSYIGIVKSI